MSRYMNRPENALKRANGKQLFNGKLLVVKSRTGFKMDAAPLNTATTLTAFHNPKTCGQFFFGQIFTQLQSENYWKCNVFDVLVKCLCKMQVRNVENADNYCHYVSATFYVYMNHVFVLWKGCDGRCNAKSFVKHLLLWKHLFLKSEFRCVIN